MKPGPDYNWKDRSDKTPCRSMNGVTDCCRICLPNSYSAGKGARCQAVTANKGTLTSFGATAELSCDVGEKLVYCSTSGLCLGSDESRKIGWRTCRSCSFTETTLADGDGVCKECALEKMHLGDASKQPPSTCRQCSSCDKLIRTSENTVLHAIKSDAQKRASILQWGAIGEELKMVEYKYTTTKLSATCIPLDRQSVISNIFFDVDVYRPNTHTQDTEILPMFYTLVRTSANCTLTACADVCRTRFHYSPACGQQETVLTKIWVLHNDLLKQYKTLTDAQKQLKLFVQHGPCQMCKPCFKGEYNAMCNVRSFWYTLLGNIVSSKLNMF